MKSEKIFWPKHFVKIYKLIVGSALFITLFTLFTYSALKDNSFFFPEISHDSFLISGIALLGVFLALSSISLAYASRKFESYESDVMLRVLKKIEKNTRAERRSKIVKRK